MLAVDAFFSALFLFRFFVPQNLHFISLSLHLSTSAPRSSGNTLSIPQAPFHSYPHSPFPSLTIGLFSLPATGSPRKEQNKFITTKKFPTTHHRCSRELNRLIITCASCRCVHFFASISCFVPQHSIPAHTLTHPHQHPAL